MEDILSVTWLQTWWPWLLAGSVLGYILLLKLVRLFRPPKFVQVNCWFCNGNTQVPIGNQNCFNCPHCDQYNGFDEFGDYNKPIPAQYHEEFNHYSNTGHNLQERTAPSMSSRESVLCQRCNINQTLKVQQLAAFVPYNENNFDLEVEYFEAYLEDLYPLCDLCEDNVYKVVRNQDQQLKTKLIGTWLQQSRPSSSMVVISSTHPVPLYIQILRLISVFSALLCLTIDLHHRNVIDVKGRLHQIITDIPPIGQHRSSFVLAGLVCVILATLFAGKNRLRYIDAVSPFIWLLSFTVNSTQQIPQFITQLPWIQKLANWLPWQICWQLGVSICCVVCSCVFLFSKRVVVRKRNFKRSENLSDNLRSTSSWDTGVRSCSVSDEPPYQPECNNVSMVSDHMTQPTNHNRNELGESLNTLSLGPPNEQKRKKKGDIWTSYTNLNSSRSSSGYVSTEPTNPHLTTLASDTSPSSKIMVFLRGVSTFCIIVLRCLAVLLAVSCCVIYLNQNGIVDVKKRVAVNMPDILPVGSQPKITRYGLACAIMATVLAWKKGLTHIGRIGVILWFLADAAGHDVAKSVWWWFLASGWHPSWLSSVNLHSPWLQHFNTLLPWKLYWQLSISICCVLYSGMLLVLNSRDLREQKLLQRESRRDIQGSNDDEDVSAASTSGSSESSHHLYGNDVSMVPENANPVQATNHDRPVLTDCLNTMTLGKPRYKKKTAEDIWTKYTNAATSSSPSQSGTSFHQRRPIIQPGKLQFTSRSNSGHQQHQQGFLSAGKDFAKFNRWHES